MDGHQPGRFACDGGGQPQDLEAPNKGPVLVGWFRNPGNSAVDMVNLPLFLGFYTSQLMQDFFCINSSLVKGAAQERYFTNNFYKRTICKGSFLGEG